MSGSEGSQLVGRVLVVDDHARARQSMADILSCAGHQVDCCASAVEALHRLQQTTFDVIITDLQMPGMNGLEFIKALEQRGEEAQIVMVTAHASVASAVDAMRHGAFDYIEKPFTADQIEQLVSRALLQGGAAAIRAAVPAGGNSPAAMIGTSPALQALRHKIRQVAPTSETVLIIGESGVGKELVARAVYESSRRAAQALVSLNCPALSPQLMESELFGHERGAFTSADTPRVGRFELADGGTILLDEVSEINLPLQAKLLRVLQERTFERVGSSETHAVDVRVLATSNRACASAAKMSPPWLSTSCNSRPAGSDALPAGSTRVPSNCSCITTGPATSANWKTSSREVACCWGKHESPPTSCAPG